ncbi:transporter substrate-binding domain-containing protein [Caballeronia sp. dw_276]|uniref:ATP-binding protein n=1 Tax=Caballeronia sp. dw_276 TaxID=2719795 RepID=UPI0021079C22|nr:transporter substrate-binding domain-containing protein [Caballeronia sp. dw_276]
MVSLRTLVTIKTPCLARNAAFFFTALLLCVSVNARTNVASNADQSKPLIIGVVPGALPPMEMSNPNESENSVRGVSADFAQRIASALQRPIQWQTFADRSTMIDALRQHRIDATTSATGNDGGASLLYSKPYVATKQVYVERRVAGAHTGKIAYVESQTSPQRLQNAYPSMHPVAYRDTLSALLAVSLGDADAFVGDLITAGYAVDHFDLVSLTLSGFAPFDEAGYSFAFAADATGEALRRRVDAALTALPPRFLMEVRARWAVAAAVTFNQPLRLSEAELAWIAAHPVIDYSMYANAAPLTFRDSSGKPAGLAIDMLSAIGALTGLTFEGHLRDSVEAVTDDIADGSSSLIPYGLSMGQIPPQFVRTKPYGEGVLAIVTRAGAKPLHDARALDGKRVALWRNHALMSMLRERVPTARIVETSPVTGQFDAVLNGDADATIADMTFANYAVGNPYRGKLAITGAFIDQPLQHGFLVARGEPMLLSILNKAIAHMQPPELDAIRRRWLLIEHPESKWEQRRPQVIFGALLAVALLALLAGWGVSLKNQVNRRRIAEQAMRRARNDAESANRAKSAFLAAMSHEIRTPMNAVLGLLELELRSPGDRASTVKALGTAHDAARDLLGMIDDILDMAKIEAGRLTLTSAPVELGAWVQGVAAIYEPAARVKGLALQVRASGECEHAWVLADALRLRQVLGNLLSNAIKFTDAGEVIVEYSITQTNTRCAFVFTVSDTGLGIAPDQQALLFAPFTQARQERPGRFGGTGLGLTICRRLMTLMNGTVALSSAPGQGSRFTVKVSLPLVEAPVDKVVSEHIETPVRAGLRVLVVDDHPANLILLTSQLKTLGCEIETASEGAAAFARWDRHRLDGLPFDLILTDCSMPVMSGEDLARAIRKREAEGQGARIPIVGVTANAQREAVDHALAAGMTQCLVKPLGLDALRHALVLASQDVEDASVAPSAGHASHDAYARFFPVSDAPIRLSKRTVRTRAYGPAHAFPSNTIGQQSVLTAPYALDANHQTNALAIDAPRFDADLLKSYGDQATPLVDALKWANQLDLDETRAARATGDFGRMHELVHRMKGAALVIGARPFADACLALQRLLEQGDQGEQAPDMTELDHAYTRFSDEAIALDTALAQHAALTQSDA